MSGAAPDLIAGYLDELYARLRVPAAEAELIAAETEDHLRETVAAGMATGMTELEAQQAAISSFGPVRIMVRAHRRRTATLGGAAMAAWKLTALLATTVGAGGLAGMAIFQYSTRSAPDGAGPVPTVMIVYAVLAAGGLVLLASRRLTGRGTPGRDPLSPGVTAGCFLLASALLGIFGFLLRSAPAPPPGPAGTCSVVCSFSSGPTAGPGPSPSLVLMVLAVYAVLAAGGLVLLATRRLTGRGTPGREPLSPGTTAGCFLLASAPLLALIVRGVTVPIAPAMSATWTTPLSYGSVSAAPLVAGAVVAGCLAVAAGYGLQAALRGARRGLGSGVLTGLAHR
jgi:hypothetical protein